MSSRFTENFSIPSSESEVTMIDLQFTEEEKQALHYERFHHPHPRVQRKMEALWLKSQGESHQHIAQLTGLTPNMITRYLKDYKAGGIEKLKEISFYQPTSELVKHQQTLEDYFKAHPPATIKEAMDRIEKITGLKRSEKSITKFFNKLGLKRRKVGMVPSKADPDKQEAFKKNISNPGSEKPKPAKGRSFLWMLLTLFWRLS
jgi:transposase